MTINISKKGILYFISGVAFLLISFYNTIYNVKPESCISQTMTILDVLLPLLGIIGCILIILTIFEIDEKA